MDFKNSNITSGAVITDLNGADSAAASEAAVALAVAMQAANIMPLSADGELVLPAGVGLDDIKVVGRDLVIQMPDGTQMIVPDGAVFVPQIVVDGVAVPPLNIAALLVGQEPQPAAGRPQSSGGNFADPVGDIGDPFGLGDLLPPTQLAFPEPEEREIIPELNDEEPTTIIITPDQPAGSVNATASVNEAALPARGTEPPGSNESSNAETTTGSIVFDAPDGLGSITLNGIAITAVGQVFVTPLGRLTITSIAPGNIGYSYTLTDNTTAPASNDIFAVVVTDRDGDAALANLTINIIDDVPTARNDTDSVPAATYTGQTGNVITGVGTTSGNAGADTQGADGAVLSGIRAGTATGTFAAAGTTINGQYGTLTIAANGSYTYTRNAGTPGGVNDIFTYQLTDGDGDTSTATLTISIADSPVTITSVPTTGAGTVVDEAGLPARGTEPPGSNSAAPSESTSGTITFTAPDGVASVQINGVTITGPGQVITVPTGTLLITGYNPATGTLAYTFTLTDNTSGDATSQVFTITVTDTDGDIDTKPFTVRIIDDVPTAVADTDSVAAGTFGPATGNVISDSEGDGGKDVQGADGVTVTNVSGAGGSGGAGTAVNGLYGVLTINADGSYSYVRNAGTPGGVSDVFSYTITDGDGDTSTTTLTIAIADSPVSLDLPVKGEAGTSVDEAGLPAGSNAAADSEKTSGTINYVAADGPAVVTIDGVAVTAVGQIFTGSFGTLKITSIANGVIGYEYLLTTNTSGDTTFDDFAIVVTDLDGDSSNGTLVIDIVDDVPTARPDVDSVTEDNFSGGELVSADGNVITGAGGSDANSADGVADTKGADGAAVTAVAFGATAGTVGGSTAGAYGTLTLNADGSYTYVLNNFDPRIQGLDSDDSLTEIFTYTLTDGDGDTRTTTLTITINGSDDRITINGLNVQAPDLIVDDDDLPDGSDTVKEPLTQTGSFTVNGVDGISSIKIEGVEAFVGQTFTTAYGTFTITSIVTNATAGGDPSSITVNYSYTLNDNVLHPDGADQNTITEIFDVDVTDSDGSTASGTVKVLIIDDVPTANDDVVNQDVENAPVTFGVFGNDIFGADGVDTDNNPVVAVTFTQPATGSVSYDPTTGLFTFTPVNGQLGTATFTYTIIDGDGDPSTATVTINLKTDSIPTVSVTDVTVNEDGLPARGGEPAGTSFGSNSHVGTGSFSITTGGDTLQKIELKDALGNWVDVTAGGTVNGANGTLVVTVVAGVYSYTYTLTDNLENHPDFITADLDGISDAADPLAGEAFDVRVTDSDNSVSAIDTLNVTVLDDAPVANNDAPLQILEDAVVPLSGNVLTNDLKGADGAVVTSVRIAGVDVVVNAVGTTNYSNAQGTYTFQANGAWTFDPNTNLNSASGTDASFTYTITDGDGDQASALQPILVLDGAGPAAGAPISLTMDDQNLSDGSTPANPDFVEGTISFTAGSDALTSFVFGPGTGALAGGLTWNRVSDTVIEGWDGPVGTGTKIVILQLTAPASIGVGLTGSVTIRATLVNNYDSHPGINIDDLVALGAINVVAADQDGDSVSQSVTLSVSDDLPTVTISGPTTVVEGASTVGGTWARSFNADQPGGSIKVIVDGTEYDLGTTITTAKGSLVVNADGTWTFTAANNLDQDVAQSFGFSIKITDADNDFVVRPFAIDITDGAGPAVGAGFTLTLDDQNLADGTTPGNPDFVSNTLTFTAGSDALTSFVFAPETGALAGGLTWVRVSNTQIEGYDGLVKIVTLTLSGPASIAPGLSGAVTVTATLHDNYDSHPAFTADDLAALGSISVIASDQDGDSVSQTVTLAVSDDVPSLDVAGPTTVVEGASTVGGTWSQTIGADQPGAVTKVVFGGVEYNLGTAINTGNGTLTVNANGTWVFAANNNLDNDLNPSVTFSVKVTDADNDVAQDPHTINITDGTAAANAAPITLEVDEAALNTGGAVGSNPGLPTEVDSSPALSFTAGSDALTSFAFSTDLSALVANLDGAGTDIVWIRSADGQTITGRLGSAAGPVAITLTLSAPASIAAGATGNVTVTATLSDNFQHANALLAQIQSLGSILVEARDHDGDVATGQVTVTVKDDVPLANPDSDSVTEDGPTVANGNVLLGAGFSPLPADVNITDGVADTQGADGASVTAFSFGANNGVVGNPAGLAGAYGTLVLNADGTYTYTLNNGLAIVQSLSLGQTLTETFSYTITDADGDPSPTTLVITINGADDGVTITGLGGNAEETVFENDLSDGSSPNAAALTQTGTFAVTAVDGLNNIVIGGVTVVSGGVLTATLTIDTPLGLMTITGFTPTLGAGGEVIGGTVSYSYLLQDNSTAHASGNGANGGVFDNFNVVVTDVDGSSNNAVLNVEIIDDVPTAVDDTVGQIAENMPFSFGVFGNDTFGADGVDTSDVTPPAGVTFTQPPVGQGTVSYNPATGLFTFTPAAGQQGSTSFTYTIIDSDGDPSTATVTVNLQTDSTPVTVNVVAAVDDDGLAGNNPASTTGDINANAGEVGAGVGNEAVYTGQLTVNFGNDTGTVSFANLHNTTGSVGTETVTYTWAGTTLTATVNAGARNGTVLYTVNLTPSGAYTVTLLDNVLHANGGNESSAPIVDLSYLASDSDGDSSTAGKLSITFNDDAPTLGTIQNGTANNLPGSAITTGALSFGPGADGAGAVGTITANTAGVTSGGKNIVTNQVGNMLTGYADVDGNGSFSAGDTAVFTLTVNPSAGTSGQYSFDLLAPLDGVIVNTPIGGSTSFGAGPTGSQILTTAAAANLSVVSGWLATGAFNAANWFNGTNTLPAGLTLASVNGSTGGWGVNNNNFTAGEFLRFDFGAPMDDFDGGGAYTPPAVTLPEISYATFDLIGYGAGDTIQFRVHYTDGTSANASVNGAQTGYTLTAPAGKFIDWIDLYTPNAGGSGKVSLTAVGVQNTVVNQTIQFGVTLNDGDNDPVTGNFSINVADGNSPSLASSMLVVDLNGGDNEFAVMAAGSEAQGAPLTPFRFGNASETSKTTEQARTSGNVTATVIAASLVGLPATTDAAAARTPDDARLEMLPGMETPTPDQVSLVSGTDTETLASQPETVTDTASAKSTSDTDSSLRAAEDSDLPAGFAAQPVSPVSDTLTGGAEVVSIADILPAATPLGGDAVMHNILDLAAANVTGASNDNPAAPALENVVDEALPDTMVDRLIDAFEGDSGAPFISSDGAADNSGYLVELINQSVSNSPGVAIIHVDPFGTQFQDMANANNG